MSVSELTLLNRDLPKWPQMIVTGPRLREELALEVIRRTDTWFVHARGCNDHEGDRRLAQRFRMPHYCDFEKDPPRQASHAHCERWKTLWGTLETCWAHNEWIASCNSGGPRGWCHPEGVLYYDDDVGKWQSIKALRADWQDLAAAFPFLALTVTLMSAGAAEVGGQPVVSMRILEGQVTLMEPQKIDIYQLEEAYKTKRRRHKEWVLLQDAAVRERFPFSEDVLNAWEKKALEVDEQLRSEAL